MGTSEQQHEDEDDKEEQKHNAERKVPATDNGGSSATAVTPATPRSSSACAIAAAKDDAEQGLPLVHEVMKQRKLVASKAASKAATKYYDDEGGCKSILASAAKASPRLTRNIGAVTIRPIASTPGAFSIVPFMSRNGTSTTTAAIADHAVEDDIESSPGESGDSPCPEEATERAALDAFLVTDEDEQITRSRSTNGSSVASTDDSSNGSSSMVRSGSSRSILEFEKIHHAVPFEEEDAEPTSRWKTGLGTAAIGVLAAAVVVLSLGLTGYIAPFTSTDDNARHDPARSVSNAGTSPKSTLERIRKEGVLKCGYAPVPGFFFEDEETGEISGFDASLCYAIGSALKVKVEFVNAKGPTRFERLANGTYDVLARGVTATMERNVYQATAKTGFAFSVPYLYTGLRAGGDPFFVTNCADKNFQHVDGDCSDLKVCVQGETTHHSILSDLLPDRKLVLVFSLDQLRQTFIQGDCNVIIQEGHNLAEQPLREAGYTGEYVVGEGLYSKEPLAIMTRNDDAEFSDFVNIILQALFVAEQQNITQASADQMPLTEVFGEGSYYQAAFRDAIQAGGNYGELHERFLQPESPRQSINMIYPDSIGTSGLLYAHPFGLVMKHDRDGTPLGPILESILTRGVLRCGVRLGRPGLASQLDNSQNLFGMDIDYCHALASGLFMGGSENVEFIEIAGAVDAATLLVNDDIDVVAGATWDLQTDMRELSTGSGFAFSTPYLYGYSDDEVNTCLMTRQDDPSWTAFVYWVVTATVYAEENAIHSATSNGMPEVFVFGPTLNRMLRDAILAVGSYADIYDRNMEPYMTRQAPNSLNGIPRLGAQHYHIPGFVKTHS